VPEKEHNQKKIKEKKRKRNAFTSNRTEAVLFGHTFDYCDLPTLTSLLSLSI